MKSIGRPALLFIILGLIFITNAILAEFIGMKIFSLEDTLGIDRWNWSLFGNNGSLQFSAGVIIWPVVFIVTDIVNEYFGRKGVRFLSLLTAGLIAYCFIGLYAAINLMPAEWWVTQNSTRGMPDMQRAFAFVFGQGSMMIVASITAFLIGQLLDAVVFNRIKKLTGDKMVWLRVNGSTFVSQLVDSFIVLYIAFVLGPQITGQYEPWDMNVFWSVGTVNFTYKILAAIALTPVIYLAHHFIDKFLGIELSEQVKIEALDD